jgi:hypothetical protein
MPQEDALHLVGELKHLRAPPPHQGSVSSLQMSIVTCSVLVGGDADRRSNYLVGAAERRPLHLL